MKFEGLKNNEEKQEEIVKRGREMGNRKERI